MESTTISASAKPHQRWGRFSLRMLMLGMTLVCVWLGLKVNALRHQREAMTIIHKAHGGVFFDYEMAALPGSPDRLVPSNLGPIVSRAMGITFSPASPNPTPSGPEWLRKFLGDEYFREVYQVSIGGPQYDYIDETEFAKLSALSEVRNLFLTNMKIATGPHMERPLRDSDLAVLENMRQLQNLRIESNNITGSGFASLVGLKRLSILTAMGKSIDDSGMQCIGKLTSLKELFLKDPAITDAGVKYLQNLISLETLDLSGSDVSDVGLQYLKELKKLKVLILRQTGVTPEGVREFKKSLPSVSIST